MRELRSLRPLRTAAVEQARDGEPRQGQEDEQVGQVLPVDAIRPERLGRVVPGLAVREDVGFRELVESIDDELDDDCLLYTSPSPRD